jgi:hypothetical protein
LKCIESRVLWGYHLARVIPSIIVFAASDAHPDLS